MYLNRLTYVIKAFSNISPGIHSYYIYLIYNYILCAFN